MAPATHQAKKQYAGSHSQQSTITSFFQRASPSSGASTPSPPEHTDSSTPILPANVQANLLSVGMRVRKSVPEGYKTGSYSAFGLFAENDATSIKPQNSAAPAPPQQLPRKYATPSLRELAPFCGIMKTGGLAQQAYADDEDELPWLSSQGSTATDVSVDEIFGNEDGFGNGNTKRRLQLDENEEPVIMGSQGYPAEHSSPHSQRAIAMPKSRRKRFGDGGPTAMPNKTFTSLDNQENMIDFEEAEFLDYSNLQEVEMTD